MEDPIGVTVPLQCSTQNSHVYQASTAACWEDGGGQAGSLVPYCHGVVIYSNEKLAYKTGWFFFWVTALKYLKYSWTLEADVCAMFLQNTSSHRSLFNSSLKFSSCLIMLGKMFGFLWNTGMKLGTVKQCRWKRNSSSENELVFKKRKQLQVQRRRDVLRLNVRECFLEDALWWHWWSW